MNLVPQNWAELWVYLTTYIVIFGIIWAYFASIDMSLASAVTILAFCVVTVYTIYVSIKDI